MNATLLAEKLTVNDLQTRVSILETSMANVTNEEATVLGLENSMAVDTDRNRQAIGNISGILRRRIHFRALLTHNMNSQTGHEIIKFDRVTENVGNCYNKTSGIFKANYEGYYMFVAHGHAEPGKELRLMLDHNNEQNCIGNNFISNASTWRGVVVTSGTYMLPNDSVFVRFFGDVYGDGSADWPPTMFSGFLAGV